MIFSWTIILLLFLVTWLYIFSIKKHDFKIQTSMINMLNENTLSVFFKDDKEQGYTLVGKIDGLNITWATPIKIHK